MLSIIVAVHNQQAMNQLFWKHLSAHTQGDWELIVIDNGSTDGSGDFFARQGAKVISNGGNYSYPFCQNQGIKAARETYLAFLNNHVRQLILICTCGLLIAMSIKAIFNPCTLHSMFLCITTYG